MRRLLTLLLGLLPLSPQAGMDEIACARKDTINGWSHLYRVDALVLRGAELNWMKQKLLYRPKSMFVVLLWDRVQSTSIELDAPVLMPGMQEGRDERGDRWQVTVGAGCK